MSKRNRNKQPSLLSPPAGGARDTERQARFDRYERFVVPAGLLVMVAIVFAQVRTHGFVHFDDPIYITDNPHVRGGLTLAGIRWAFTSLDFNWHPLTWITHMIDVDLFGLDAGKHLMMNVAWHAANAILLYFVLRRLTGSMRRSAIVAFLFAIHPLHVESVAWIAERKDVLSAFFFLLTLWFYAGWAKSGKRSAYALSIVALALGLMSKGMLVTTPFVLLLLDYWPLQRELNARRIIEKIPHFILMIGGIVITYVGQRVVDATKANAIVPLSTRIARAITSYALYLGKTFWPWSLAIPYPYRYGMSTPALALSAVVMLAITAIVIRYRERRSLFVGWFWFTGMLVPVIGLVQIGNQGMADRYTYLPLIGLFIAIVWLVPAAARSGPDPITGFAWTAVLIVLMWASVKQASYWSDSLALFRHAIDVTSGNETAHTALGSALLDQGDVNGAANQMRIALRLTPNDWVAHAGLGAALRLLGDNAGAARELRTAIAANPRDPRALEHYAEVLRAQGDTKGAIDNLEKSLALRDDLETRAELAAARGNDNEAIADYEAALRDKPGSPSLNNDLAAVLARNGRDADALAHYEEALRVAPDHYDANMNAGALLSRMSRNAEARVHFAAAAKSRPQSVEPLVYLSLIDTQDGRFVDAAREIDSAMNADLAATNAELTNALHRPTNANDYRSFLASKITQPSAR